MSHLTPHRSVRITPGGGAATDAIVGVPVEPDTSWDGLIADLAAAVGLEGPAATDFATRVDDVVDAIPGYGDPEIARTRVRAALLGNTSMLQDLADIDLSAQRVEDLVAATVQDDRGEPDRVVARLALMHDALVAPSPGDDTVGEGSGGSATTLPETAPEPDNTVGQVAYTHGDIPEHAKDVVSWIGQADTDDDRRARAQAALEVEDARPGDRRTTVDKAIAAVLDG